MDKYVEPGIGTKSFNTFYGELYHELERLIGLLNQYLYVYRSWRVSFALICIQVALLMWKTLNRPKTTPDANKAYHL